MTYEHKYVFKKFKIVLLVVILLLLICIPVFKYFQLTTEARITLREAKNVKLQLQAIDVEYYALGTSVYDASSANGLNSGVLERIRDFMENSCDITIYSYDKKDRAVTGFIYTNGNYQAVYSYDSELGESWKVSYIMNVLEYNGK